MNHIVRNYGDDPNPRKVAAEEVADLDVRAGRVARYRDGCELSLEPGEDAPDTCPGEGCDAGLSGILVPDGGLTAWRERPNTVPGGEGLPPSDHEGENTWLFTCVECGRRWVDPTAPVTSCACGGDVVAHQFEHDEYRRLRWYDDPRSPEVIDHAE
ncbi:hypothetical protein [Halorubellus salinus]|uniref:hypothetical protein n=1 Tax=Halorubellus salinus TaxID=755309 RepID=UPI001D0954F0|nr:hypothetical protein [Halorubellus salinus]